MRRLNVERGLTFLIVTHDISVGEQTDRIVHMLDGEVVESAERRARARAGDDEALRHPGRHAPRRPAFDARPRPWGHRRPGAEAPILVKLGVRNVGRRRGRTALIVVGLMLGTTIIATALTTGDTMSHTIRGTAVATLGQTDELVSARGTEISLGTGLGSATGIEYFDESVVDQIEQELADTNLVDGITPAIIEQVAVQAPLQRQTEPRVTMFAADPERMAGFGAIVGSAGEARVAAISLGAARSS